MSDQLVFPTKYHIVWLDAHIGDPKSCRQLKRAFFTHVDPDSGKEVCPSDKDIDRFIECESEITVTFDSFHCILKAFIEEAACLKYVDEIQNHRILFIASSKLGQSAVAKLLERYIHSFTNNKNGKPYGSVYIFCTDIAKASEWATDYCEYVKIFDFETDLLARMTKDVGEEFFEHGQQLLEANQNRAAIERLSWAKSLFIRHDKLKLPSDSAKKQQFTDTNTRTEQESARYTQSPSNQQPKPSPKLLQIDKLLETAEERVKQQSEDDSDENNCQTQTIANEVSCPIADHLIIWLNEPNNSCEQMEIEGEYKTDTSKSTAVQTDDSSTRYRHQFEREMQACFANIPGDLEIFHDIDDCRQCINENASTKTIFLITPCSIAEKMLICLPEICSLIKRIYVLGSYISGIVGWADHYRNENIEILFFDVHKNLLIHLLQDISKHYLSKGEDRKRPILSSANTTLVYFGWAKEMVIRANQIGQNEFKHQLNNIEKYKSETEELIRQTDLNYDVEQRLRSYLLDEDSDSVAVIFIVGLEMKLIHLASGIAQLITCTTNEQVVSAINNVKLVTPIIVVSSALPSDNLMSLTQLLYYYCFLQRGGAVQTSTTKYLNVTYVSSTDHLMNQLYHKLGQYYRDSAIQASVESKDQNKAKRLLERSTQCYKLLEADTEKTLKRYAEMLQSKKT